jgi:excisionase family DNA binding protein
MRKAVLTITEAAYYVGLREGAILRSTRQGTIPYRRIGRRRVFIKAELDLWLALLPGVSVADALAVAHAADDHRRSRRLAAAKPALHATA